MQDMIWKRGNTLLYKGGVTDPNEVARNLYSSFGFEEKELPKGWDEVPAVMKL